MPQTLGSAVFYAQSCHEPEPVLARCPGDCCDNLRSLQIVFRMVLTDAIRVLNFRREYAMLINRDDMGVSSHAVVMKQRREMYQFTKDDNTLKRHFQMMVEREDFLEQIGNWLELYGDKRLLLLRHLVFEIDMSETEQLKETLYEYGSYLTEKNYCGRKLFSMMAVLIGQLEASNNMKIQE